MRVTGGAARGVPLQSPVAPGVRPTTDRVRSALFSILTGYGLEETVVADLYAGTGSLGIEALSRGAAHADLVEADRRQVAVIKANLTATKARLLLMACLLKFGSLPPAEDPDNPTAGELEAIRVALADYQAVFDTH